MKYLLILLGALLVVGCSTTPSTSLEVNDNTTRVGVDQLGRTPLPGGSKIRAADSLIFGVGDNWMGRAVIEIPADSSSTYNYFADQFVKQGWSLVAAMRGKRSLLVFTRADRSATIEMDEGGLLSNVVAVITISPTGNTGAAPTGGVVVQPIGGAGARRP
jgi:hypothetical protein